MTDLFRFPLSAVRDSVPFFFELQLGCLSPVLTSHPIPQKMQYDLKSKCIAECDHLVRLVTLTELHW